MTTIQVNTFSDSQILSQFAAGLLVESVAKAVAERGRFLVALSGGGTPTMLYRLMAQPSHRESLPWDRMLFFWGDERCVPPDDVESCFNQARLAWLGHVPVPEANIYRIKGELGPQAAAEEYASRLKAIAPDGSDWPRFDLVLLGLGADGHTASLFPGSAETHGLATVPVSAHYQDRPANRISLTPDVFNDARNVVFLAAGREKAHALAATLTGSRDPLLLPAQRIKPAAGQLWFLADESAASLLPEQIEGVTLTRHFAAQNDAI